MNTTTTKERAALPEGVVVRAVQLTDAEQLQAMRADPAVFHPGSAGLPYVPLERIRAWIERLGTPPTIALVAELEGMLLGSAELTPFTGRRAHAGGIGMGVHAAWHGRGVGSRLMTELLDIADNWLGLRRVELRLFADNEAALALYRKFGFEVEAHIRGEALRDGVFIDGLLMARLRPGAPFAAA